MSELSDRGRSSEINCNGRTNLCRRDQANPDARFPARRGFTLVEILVVAGIIAVLVGLLLPMIGRARAAARAVSCVAHLHDLAASFHLYAANNDGILPDAYTNHMTWERSLQPFISGHGLFICPADNELYPGGGISSYDWRDTGSPLTTLSGHPLFSARSNAVLVFDALPTWHTANHVNAARVDGSAGEMTETEFFTDLGSTPNSLSAH